MAEKKTSRASKFPEMKPVLEKYASKRGSLITILQKAQGIYGYLCPELINYISEATGILPAKIYGVATFYSQFRLKPVGKHLIMVCQGTACHVNGADGIAEVISEYLGIENGETTADGLFTLNTVACLGCCSLAPVMMVQTNGDSETYGNLTKESVKKALEEIKAADAAAASDDSMPQNNKASGSNNAKNKKVKAQARKNAPKEVAV